MSQATTWAMQSIGPANATAVAARVNASLNALLSAHSGTTAPAYAVEGTFWLDTAVATAWAYKVRRTGAWQTIFTINPTTGALIFPDLDAKYALAGQNKWMTVNQGTTVAQAGALDFNLALGADQHRFTFSGSFVSTSGLRAYLSPNGGATFYQDPTHYYNGGFTATGAATMVGLAPQNLSYIRLSHDQQDLATVPAASFSIEVDVFTGNPQSRPIAVGRGIMHSNQYMASFQYGGSLNGAGRCNFIRFMPINGVFQTGITYCQESRFA